MKAALSLFLVLTLAATSAQAGSIYIKRNKDNALPDAPVEQQAPAPLPTKDMNEIAPTVPPENAMPSTTEAPAEETIESFAERYMQNCMKKQDPVLKGEPLNMLCACSASKLQETMTVEQVKTMMTNTPQGQAERNRMAVYVYAPCMEYPAKALMQHRCDEYQKNLQANSALDGEAICSCFANNMALFTAANAQGVMAKQLTENPNDPDPLGHFLNSAEYKKQTDAAFLACVQSNGGMAQQPAPAAQ